MASPSVTCYPIPGKPKAQRLCEAFAAGVRAAGERADICAAPPSELRPGSAAFYGVRPAVEHLWHQARREGRDWYYIDNAYFDCGRERYFRITRNALQVDGLNACWSKQGAQRFAALRLPVHEWRRDGSHVVICPQSDEFMRGVGGYTGDWVSDVTAALKRHTERPLRIRAKSDRRPLMDDLKGAWALVTHMSCAAAEALLAGVPVFCTGRCSARWLGHGDVTAIETPVYPGGRLEWAAVLSENQWTLDEIAAGMAWKAWHA